MSHVTCHRQPLSLLARSVLGLSLCLLGTGFGYGQESAPPTESTPTAEIAVTEIAQTDISVVQADAPAVAPVVEVKAIEGADATPPAVDTKPAEAIPADTKDRQSNHADRPHRGRGPMGPREAGRNHKSGRPSFSGKSQPSGMKFGRGGFGGMSRSSGGPSGRHFGGFGPRSEGRDRSEHSRYGMGHGSRGSSPRFGRHMSHARHQTGFGPREFGGHWGRFSPDGRGHAGRFAHSSHRGSDRGQGGVARFGRSLHSGPHSFGGGFGRRNSGWGESSLSYRPMSHFSGGPGRHATDRDSDHSRGPGRGFGMMAAHHRDPHSPFGQGHDQGRHFGMERHSGDHGPRMHSTERRGRPPGESHHDNHHSRGHHEGAGHHSHGDHGPDNDDRGSESHGQ